MDQGEHAPDEDGTSAEGETRREGQAIPGPGEELGEGVFGGEPRKKEEELTQELTGVVSFAKRKLVDTMETSRSALALRGDPPTRGRTPPWSKRG